MTPEQWERVKALFAAANALPTAERAGFLAREDGVDDELRREVESLLEAAEGTDSLPGVRAAIANAAREVEPSRGARDAALRVALEGALGPAYEIIRPLGHGGMGAVFLARERTLERFVAIKVLRPELAGAEQWRERFRREARVAARLSHPGIVPLHGFGEAGGLWYFVMGYVPGITLAERLRVEGRLRASEAHHILAELAEALDCAHRAGVIHRDIKPANVLLDASTGHAVLADFGIAQVRDAADGLTASGMIVGTPSYMSPEQALGHADIDARSDLWSLGAVGFAMLAGREPRAAGRVTLEPGSLPPEVPPGLVAVVARCLEPAPARRWPSARALADALALVDEDAGAGLPGPVRELPAFGPYALLWAALWLGLAASPFRHTGDRALLVLIGLIVPVGLVMHVGNVAGGELPALQLARVAFWPPDWWGVWWPRALRRPSDLWRRLPRAARVVRIALSLFIVAVPALILARQWVEQVTGAGVGWFGRAELLCVLLVGAIIVVEGAWARTRGLTWVETSRLLFGATASVSGWNSPGLRRLLASPTGAVGAEPRDAADYPAAIEAVVARLEAPWRDDATRAADAAYRLAGLVSRCDAELRALEKVSDADDAERRAAQLSALEGLAAADAQAGELAALLRAQDAVVERVRLRRESLASRRSHLLHLLHGTWLRITALLAGDDADRREELASLDELRDEMEAELRTA